MAVRPRRSWYSGSRLLRRTEPPKPWHSSATVVAGGVIPTDDYEFLYSHGVKNVFGPGTRVPAAARTIIADLVSDLAKEEAAASA